MRLSALLLSALFAPPFVGCGDEALNDANGDGIDDSIVAPNNVSVVVPTKPLGFVAGQVTTIVDGRPIAGATVLLLGAGAPSTQVVTAEDGSFSFGPIAAGAAFELRVTADGYASALLPALSIDDAAGNFPTANGALFVGPIALIPTTGRFTAQVVSHGGSPVANAAVTIESAVRFFVNDAPHDGFVASVASDVDGLAAFTGIPDAHALPPRLAALAGIVVNVAPVDLNNDGTIDLRGATLSVSGADVREGALPALLVLEAPGHDELAIVASNVSQLVTSSSGTPSILARAENIRIVFNKPIKRETILVDLRDESGDTTIPAPFVLGLVGNVLTIDPATDLEAGREYNLVVRVESASGLAETLSAGSPLFGQPDSGISLAITARFRDLNGDGLWGNASDALELTASLPIGRAGASPAFTLKLWVDLDLSGNGIVGDSIGELPPLGGVYPAPLLIRSAERAPGNGAGLSGFTRAIEPVRIPLVTPRTQLSGAVAFEARIDAGDNGDELVTDVGGRLAPARTQGSAALQ